jgi:hypothetical protein
VRKFTFLGNKSDRWLRKRSHERIKSAENYYQLVVDTHIHRKWNNTKAGKNNLEITTCLHEHMEQKHGHRQRQIFVN